MVVIVVRGGTPALSWAVSPEDEVERFSEGFDMLLDPLLPLSFFSSSLLENTHCSPLSSLILLFWKVVAAASQWSRKASTYVSSNQTVRDNFHSEKMIVRFGEVRIDRKEVLYYLMPCHILSVATSLD